MNEIWMQRDGEKINFSVYKNKDDISEIQRNNPEMVYIALLFDDDPIQNHSIRFYNFIQFVNNNYFNHNSNGNN